jgi:propionyl-CoA carboxylase alpha chain
MFSKDRFVKGNITTNFIAEEYPNGLTAEHLPTDDPSALIAVAAAMKRRIVERNVKISGQFPGHEMKPPVHWTVYFSGKYHNVDVHPAPGGYAVVIAGEAVEVKTDWQVGDPLIRATLDGVPVCVQVDRTGVSFRLSHQGLQAEVWVLTRRTAEMHRLMPFKAPPDMSKYLLSPMPGLLSRLLVEEGQEVKAGEPIAVIEAMKMENILKAERDTRIAKVHAAAGDSLAVDQKIVEFAA